MSNSPTGLDDPERDAWLREALRHAPDADAAPPAAVQEAILKQARAATARAPVAREASPWASAWAWLARPPVAAGFASVMAATLVGLMWWDRPMDEALPHAPAPERRSAVATALPLPPAAPAASSGAAVAAAAPPAATEATADAARAAPAPAAPANARPPAKPARRAAPPAADAAQAPADAERREPEPFKSERKDAAVAPQIAPQVAPATAPLPAAEARESAPAARMRESAAGAAAADERAAPARDESSVASAASSGSLTARAFAKAAAPPPAAAMQLQQNSDKIERTTAPLAELIASVNAAPQRWSVERGGTTQAVSAPLQRWLARLAAESASRWRAAAGAVPSEASTIVRFYRDGVLRATVYLDDGGAWVVLPEAPVRGSRAVLSPSVGAMLKGSLADAMR